MSSIKNFDLFVNEQYETKNSGNWIVYSTDNKVIGCNLSREDAEKLSKKNGEHNVGGQNGKTFKSIEEAQAWLDGKKEKSKTETDSKITSIVSDPIRKQLYSLSNLLKRRFAKVSPFLFAFWIGKTFGITKFLYVTKIERSQHINDTKHVYCNVGDYYFDIDGFHTMREVMLKEELNKWNLNDFIFTGNNEIVNKLRNESSDLSQKGKQEMISTIVQFKNNIKK
jgi:hypothetical protein